LHVTLSIERVWTQLDSAPISKSRQNLVRNGEKLIFSWFLEVGAASASDGLALAWLRCLVRLDDGRIVRARTFWSAWVSASLLALRAR